MKHLLVILSLLIVTGLHAQKNNTDTLTIRTSAVCEMCVETIEGNLIYEKGVKAVKLDLQTGIVTVDYAPKKTTPEAIRTALTRLGYYADDMPGDEKAFSQLPDCCQKEGCGGKVPTPAEHH